MAALIVPKGSEAALLPLVVKDEFTNAACGDMPADSIPLVKFAHGGDQAKSTRGYAAMPQSVESLPEDVDTPESAASETPAQLALALAAVARPRISVPGQANPGEGGEAGGGGVPGISDVSNAAFISAVYHNVPAGAGTVVCSKRGDPETGGWPAIPAGEAAEQCPPTHNNYLNCSTFYPEIDGSINARKETFAAFHCLVLDDVGTKVPRVAGFTPTWEIETSLGNSQVGFVLDAPLTDGAEGTRLQNAVISANLSDPGASGLTRWVRLPGAINGKPKHRGTAGEPFECRLVQWNPQCRYTVKELVAGLKLNPAPDARSGRTGKALQQAARGYQERADNVYTPKAAENPVVTALKAHRLYKAPMGAGKHDITCPWSHEHTDALDTGAAYFEPTEAHPGGGFCCQHSHRDQYHIGQLIQLLDLTSTQARNRPGIRVVAGEMDGVIGAAERVLAARGNHYQTGGLIVSIAVDPVTGDASIVPTSLQALTKELSVAADWEKFDSRKNSFVRCDPPQRHISMLFDGQEFPHLLPLAGLARQPYFRESDGELVTRAGYDLGSQRYGVFAPSDYVLPEPTHDAALAALATLEELIAGFRFAAPSDRAAALAAIFTAVVRPSLAHAPAFHVRAPIYGSGKTFLCELIGAFAGPAQNLKVSYPKTSEEATKSILSLLLTGPAVVEFDDMDNDWAPHGVIKRMLTADKISDRILGVSKTATVSTRTLFLGSGNNVGAVRDLLRRVLTIHIDPRCAIPATLTYSTNPVAMVRKERGRYVSAVLTIIQAWRRAASPRQGAASLATFGGAWSDYCRCPLMWLGHPDPATALFDQIKHDPDSEALGNLMVEWRREFGSTPTTVRKALEANDPDLNDALCELPVVENGRVNRSKLGWFLKKSANRIVGQFEFRRSGADGRTAWAVVPAGPTTVASAPPSPPLPSLLAPAVKTGAVESGEFESADF